MKNKNIALRVSELADAYALETLYNEMKPLFPRDNIYFSVNYKSKESRRLLEKYPQLENGLIQPDYKLNNSDADLVIMARSDTTEDLSRYELGPYRTLAIDAAVLKAMRKLPTPEQCMKIRGQFGLGKTDKPLIVIGWLGAYNNPRDKKGEREKEQVKGLLALLTKHAHLVTTPAKCEMPVLRYCNLDETILSNITEVTALGELAKLYAIADIALSGHNFRQYGGNLNNFFEQSQRGPIFLVPTENPKQYGYREFVMQGLVRPCRNIEEIAEQTIKHLAQLKNNPQLKEEHRKKWLAHRKKTREQFLPEIFDRINWILKSGNAKKLFTYTHPDSDWGNHYFGDNPIETFRDDYRSKIRGSKAEEEAK